MNTDKKKTTPECNKRASLKYQRKKERLNVLFDIGTKDRIKSAYGNISINAYINKLINDDLKAQENKKAFSPDDIFKPI